MSRNTIIAIVAAALTIGGLFVCCVGIGGSWLWFRNQQAVPNLAKNEKADQKQAPKAPMGDMTFVAWNAQRPENPTSVRGKVLLTNYWNYAYKNCDATHYSFNFTDPTNFGRFQSIWAEKDSSDSKKLFEICKDGKPHLMTLKVSWVGPDGAPTKSGNQGVLVVGIDSDR
jgi:hypothetical protein